jgi:RNA polymerase sigma-32 factor
MINDYVLKFYSQVKLGSSRLQKKLFYGFNQMLIEEHVMDGNATVQASALSARLDEDPLQIEQILSRLMYKDQSLDSPVTDSADICFMDFLIDEESNTEDQIIKAQQSAFVKSWIDGALAELTPREQEIARRRLLTDNPQTLEVMGRRYAISKERVRQIENSVKVKLRKSLAGHMDSGQQSDNECVQ